MDGITGTRREQTTWAIWKAIAPGAPRPPWMRGNETGAGRHRRRPGRDRGPLLPHAGVRHGRACAACSARASNRNERLRRAAGHAGAGGLSRRDPRRGAARRVHRLRFAPLFGAVSRARRPRCWRATACARICSSGCTRCRSSRLRCAISAARRAWSSPRATTPPNTTATRSTGRTAASARPSRRRRSSRASRRRRCLARSGAILTRPWRTGASRSSARAEDEAYYAASLSVLPCPALLRERGGALPVVYTPLHGTGLHPRAGAAAPRGRDAGVRRARAGGARTARSPPCTRPTAEDRTRSPGHRAGGGEGRARVPGHRPGRRPPGRGRAPHGRRLERAHGQPDRQPAAGAPALRRTGRRARCRQTARRSSPSSPRAWRTPSPRATAWRWWTC